MTPNVQCLRYLTTLLHVYVICHFWTPICNVRGYWRHRSVCYTSLLTTPLVNYNPCFTMCYDPLMSCLGAVLWSLLLSVRWSLFSVFITVSLLSMSLLLLSSVFSLLSLIFLCLCAEQSRPVAYCRQPASTVTLGIELRWDPWPYICSVSRLLFFLLSLFLLW
jgi:hypothetical protein